MTDSLPVRRNWKLLLNIATAIALVVLAYAIRGQLKTTVGYLDKVNAWALLLMIPLQIWNYYAQTKLTQGLFAILGDKLDFEWLYRLQLELNFVNTVFPSNGLSGASYFAARVRSRTISTGKSSFIYLMKLAMTFFAFEIILFLGLFFLALGGHVNNFVILAATFSTTLIIVGTLAAAYVISNESRLKATLRGLTIGINKIIQIFRPKYPETIKLERLRRVASDLHDNYTLIRSKFKELKGPLWYGFLNNLTEILTIYVVYVAFGRWVNPGAVILAYALANFAGFVSVLPSGVGMYEAIMTGVLIAAGVPARISLPVTIMYRVLNTLIQVPVGYYFYRKALKSSPQKAVDAT